ncbi:MAG: hypothetical protein MRK01_15875 [Candidatus Scalindua sp.]|nr:hypothetical protein [Candidatus Scalindua sp.]
MFKRIPVNKITSFERGVVRLQLYCIPIFVFFLFIPFLMRTDDVYGQCASNAKYIILMIADGNGIKHNEATNKYTGVTPYYQSAPEWLNYFVSTFHSGGSYNTTSCWNSFSYVISDSAKNITDSAAAASALYSGTKTAKRISVSQRMMLTVY